MCDSVPCVFFLSYGHLKNWLPAVVGELSSRKNDRLFWLLLISLFYIVKFIHAHPVAKKKASVKLFVTLVIYNFFSNI